MQTKKTFPFILVLIFTAMVSGQTLKPTLTFAEKEFDFGTVKDSDGMVTHDFEFTNEGKVPLIINEVKSSCGCAVPEWPKEPVLPGKSGVIRVTFNPSRQTGAIYKTVQIISNGDMPKVTLAIRGVVIPVDQVEEVYRYTLGNIRIQTIYAAFGEIYRGQPSRFNIKVMNSSASEPAALSFRKVPAHLKIRMVPVVLEPGQEGIIEIEYLTSLINDWDYVVDRLDLLINNQAAPNNRINVTANIREDFSGLSAEELAMAPRAVFDNQQHDFGVIKDDKKVEHAFTLTNSGKTNLHIRKVTASCGCTAVQPAKTTIPPGDSTVIKAVFDAKGREGNQKKAITVITNDPKRVRSILWINAVVQPANQAPKP